MGPTERGPLSCLSSYVREQPGVISFIHCPDDDGVRIVSSGPGRRACQPLGYVVSLWILSVTASVVGVEV